MCSQKFATTLKSPSSEKMRHEKTLGATTRKYCWEQRAEIDRGKGKSGLKQTIVKGKNRDRDNVYT